LAKSQTPVILPSLPKWAFYNLMHPPSTHWAVSRALTIIWLCAAVFFLLPESSSAATKKRRGKAPRIYAAKSVIVPASKSLPAGLVALWRGETNGQDSIGTSHGILMNGASFAPGISGQGFLLDGNNDFIRIPDSPALHLSNELTVELWFKRADSSSYGVLIDKRNFSSCNYGVTMAPDWGFQLYYDAGAGFRILFSQVPSADVFHHMAGTYRQVDDNHVELKTYIDGQLVVTGTFSGNLNNSFNSDPLAIGADRDGLGGTFFRGVIDEVALYSRALSASEIESNYTAIVTNLPPPPPPPPPGTNQGTLIALWHADGDAQDAVGGNHGTLMGGAGFTSGVSGQGFLLDGVNDFVRIPDSASLHISNEVTVEMWFKREDASSYGTLIDKRNWTSCNYGVIMSADWGFQLYYNDPAINDGNMFEISFSGVPSAGVFHHLAGTLRQVDSAHVEMRSYIDGQLARTDTLRGNLANTFNSDALAIGSARDGSDGFFRGVIDEVALYSRALTPAEIVEHAGGVESAPQILSQPASLAVETGSPATFTVTAIGSAPLRYQWRFNNDDLPGETNGLLTIPAVQSESLGDYLVVVANTVGSVTSVIASLTIAQSGTPPSFSSQPSLFHSAAAGESVSFNVTMSGTPPFGFQWLFNGVAIPGAVSSSLVLSNVQSENAGTYRVTVSNSYGFITSAGSTLNVTGDGGGTVSFANSSSNRVYDVDGTTPIPAGAGYVALMYAGDDTNSLAAVGGTAGFLATGRFFGGTRTIAAISPGNVAYVQVRVWDSAISSSYEEAVALGGKHGASSVFPVTLGGGIIPPALLTAMHSFSLEAGTGVAPRRKLPTATSAPSRIANVTRSQQGTSLLITGPVGVTYIIEASSDFLSWTPIGQVLNNSGAVNFVDDENSPGAQRFYRARVIAK
jgi:hypothetical protein